MVRYLLQGECDSMVKKIETDDLEIALDEILKSEAEPLSDFESRSDAEKNYPDAKMPGIYVIIANEQCLYIGSAGERGGHGICQRLYDLYNNQHNLSYHLGHVTKHDVSIETLRGCTVQWGIEKDAAKRNLLEQFAIIRLRPKHFNGDGC